jgi:hypothetical protein
MLFQPSLAGNRDDNRGKNGNRETVDSNSNLARIRQHDRSFPKIEQFRNIESNAFAEPLLPLNLAGLRQYHPYRVVRCR